MRHFNDLYGIRPPFLVQIDRSLTKQGWAADAKAAGDIVKRAQEAASKYPIIGDDEYWYVWSIEDLEYINTGVKATGGSGLPTPSISDIGKIMLVVGNKVEVEVIPELEITVLAEESLVEISNYNFDAFTIGSNIIITLTFPGGREISLSGIVNVYPDEDNFIGIIFGDDGIINGIGHLNDSQTLLVNFNISPNVDTNITISGITEQYDGARWEMINILLPLCVLFTAPALWDQEHNRYDIPVNANILANKDFNEIKAAIENGSGILATMKLFYTNDENIDSTICYSSVQFDNLSYGLENYNLDTLQFNVSMYSDSIDVSGNIFMDLSTTRYQPKLS